MVLLPPRFNLPPIDGTVLPALAIDFHLNNNPDCLFALLHDIGDSTQTRITYKQLALAVHRAAHLFNPEASISKGTTVGIVISTDTIVYITVFLAVMRAGLVPFPISPRIPVAGVVHLLKATGTSRLVTGGSPAIDELRATLESTLQSDHQQGSISFVDLPKYEDLFVSEQPSGSNAMKQKLPLFPGLHPTPANSPVCILHSSGSTGMPKVIVFHLEGVFKNYIIRPVPQMLAEPDTRVGTMASPTFHSMGTMMQVFMPLYTGYTQALFAPHCPPVVPTPHSTLQAATCLRCDYAWAQDEDAISRLGKLKCVMFGGGSLAEAVGNKLVNRGVRLLPMYGATELGTVVELNYAERDPYDWPYVKFVPRISIHLDPQHDESGTYELVYVETDGHKPFVYNSTVNGHSAYKSKDLVVRHLTNPAMFKIVGRLDDQIALSNGEKCNPLPMEVEIVNSPHVHAAVVFGRERNQTGVIIELEEHLSDRYDDKRSRAKLMDEIWPYVENANRISSTHARLARDAIILTHPAHPFPRTPKGTVSRSAVLKLYAENIDTMYAGLEQGAHGPDSVEPPEAWDDCKVISAWIGGYVRDILGREVDLDKDLFQQGMDSLTATFLLRALRNAMKESSQENVKNAASLLNQQTIFERPTVSQITAHLLQLRSNGSACAEPSIDILAQIKSMIKKYDCHWPIDAKDDITTPRPGQKEHVLITGTSGGLGSHILGQLLQHDRVEKVWALNRKGNTSNKARQQESFEDKLLDVRLLESDKLTLLEADLEEDQLGLSAELYNEICSQATVIIHNAWPVNFNLSLQSFEPSVRGARNLLNLALNSTSPVGGPRFLFTSSVSVVGLGNHMGRLKEGYIRLEDTVATCGLGYGYSKLVTEELLRSARERGLEACIARLGQLTGDLASGAWPVSDWLPAILASSVSAGCLPATNGTVSWVPLDIAARSIIDASLSRGIVLPPVIHIAHPRPVPWMDIMNLFSKHLSPNNELTSLPIVRFNQWSQRVGESAARFRGPEEQRYRLFPSQKIQNTIDAIASADDRLGDTGDWESGGIVRLDTREAEQVSEALRNADELGEDYVRKWIKYWRGRGLFAYS